MKVFIVLCLAVASTSALNLRGSKFVDISPVVPFHEPESRITNGLTAKSNQFPYQVGLSLRLASGSAWCGGSLIAKDWILTAAHCTDGVRSIQAYLGSITRQAGTRVNVLQIIIHPQWNANTVLNDISLLRIPPVTLSDSINIVPLPAVATTYSEYTNEVVIASGWGLTADSGAVANTLQYATMTIAPNSVCSKVYGTSIVKPSNICIATYGGTSTCNGDSGGPIVLKDSGVLVGATSFGAQAGCSLGYPVAFTRVTSYRKWIKDTTGA